MRKLTSVLLFLLSLTSIASDRPNVLMLIVDDMNHYGFYNTYPEIQMPHLDKLKAESITFKNAACAAPVCGPSRAAVFSGLYPHTTGAYRNGADPWRKAPLNDTESLIELFQRSGYLTFGHGKIFHAKLDDGRVEAMFSNKPHAGGFGPFLPPGEEFPIKGDKFWISVPWTGPDEDFPDVRNMKSTIEFLDQSHEEPFFAVLGLWRPHTPFTAPKRFFDLYDKDSMPLPPGYRANDLADVPEPGHVLSDNWKRRWEQTGASDHDNWRHMLWGYAAAHSFADWTVGQVMQALDDSDYADNTIVILWSDNGYHMGEKDHYEKGTVWELSAQSPMLIRLPDRKHAGTLCIRPVGSIDIFPTLMDVCDLKQPDHTPGGTSLVPLLKDPEAKWELPNITSYGESIISLRSEKFRYILYPDGTEELYDHDNDPHEWNNLANNPEYRGIIRKLKKYLPDSFAPSLGGRRG
ncbi:MAG: sulfatase [Puniceicoccaceae bacterium]